MNARPTFRSESLPILSTPKTSRANLNEYQSIKQVTTYHKSMTNKENKENDYGSFCQYDTRKSLHKSQRRKVKRKKTISNLDLEFDLKE